MKFTLIFVSSCLLFSGSLSLPANSEFRQESLHLKAAPAEVPSHLMEAEHRGPKDIGPFKHIMDRVLTSKTASAVDGVVSSVVNLAGGVFEDLGNFVVETVDQLPKAIREISSTVGQAVDGKREQVLIMIKGIVPAQAVNFTEEIPVVAGEAIDRVEEHVKDSQFQFSLGKLEEVIGTFFGKLIGTTYVRAEEINQAIEHGIRRITGINNKTETSKTDTETKEQQTENFEKQVQKLIIPTIEDETFNEI